MLKAYHDQPRISEADVRNPIRTMWNSVVLQALRDADYAGVNVSSILERSVARIWLTTKSADLLEVCSNAGISWESILEHSRERAATGWPSLRLTRGEP